MEQEDHLQTAQDFLTASDREFLDGDKLQASEKLWGAATHAVVAAAVERTCCAGDSLPLRNSTRTSITTRWKTSKSSSTARKCTGLYTAWWRC